MAASVPVRLSHVWRIHEGRVVVFSDANFNVVRMELNGVGSRVWELIDGTNTVDEIIAVLAAENPSTPRWEIACAVQEFLQELRSEWLVMSHEELQTYE